MTRDVSFSKDRIQAFLETLERLAAGDPQGTLPVSARHDELDAIAHGINVLAGELRWAHARVTESERVRAAELREEAVRAADAKFAVAFRSNPGAMVVARVWDWRFQDVNASFEQQTGYARDEVVGRTLEEIGIRIEPGDLSAVRSELQTSGKFSGREVRYTHRNGTPMTAVCSADIILFGGAPCVLCAGVDITERKQAEVQVATLREELAHVGRIKTLDALAGSLAHEINQPLTAIMANAETALRLMAASSLPGVEIREVLQEIVSDNRRAGDVVRRVRSLLRKSAPRFEAIDANTVISDVLKLVQTNVVGRRIALDVELEPGLEPVMGDRTQIQQVVLNLLMNAFDAVQESEPAGRQVRLRTIRRGDAAVIEVSDRGPHVPDDVLARIYEPFYSTKRDGMGLGLSICRTIVESHGGALNATRSPGTGMTFSVSIPLSKPVEPAGSPVAAARRLVESS